MSPQPPFGERLRALMAEQGLSGAQLAELSGLSAVSVYFYLQGTRRPSLDSVSKLRRALGVNELALPAPEGARPRALAKRPVSRPEERDDFVQGFSIRLRAAVELNGLTFGDAAALCGIGAPAMSRYLAGERDPRASSVALLAQGLGVSTDQLLGLRPWSLDRHLDHCVRIVEANAGKLRPDQRREMLLVLRELDGPDTQELDG